MFEASYIHIISCFISSTILRIFFGISDILYRLIYKLTGPETKDGGYSMFNLYMILRNEVVDNLRVYKREIAQKQQTCTKYHMDEYDWFYSAFVILFKRLSGCFFIIFYY